MSADRVIHAYVAGVTDVAWAGVGVVFVDAHGVVLRRVARRVPVSAEHVAEFRGILHALWMARRLGSQRVVVHCDNPTVVAMINGHREVRLDLVGPYLEVRALLHAYRSARVEAGQMGWEQDAAAMAAAALAFDVSAPPLTDVIVEDMPLWSWQTAAERAPV